MVQCLPAGPAAQPPPHCQGMLCATPFYVREQPRIRQSANTRLGPEHPFASQQRALAAADMGGAAPGLIRRMWRRAELEARKKEAAAAAARMEEAVEAEREAAAALEGGGRRLRELGAEVERLREAQDKDAQDAQVRGRPSIACCLVLGGVLSASGIHHPCSIGTVRAP